MHTTSGIHDIYQPLGGLAGRMIEVRSQSDEPRFTSRTVQMGDLSRVWANICCAEAARRIGGAGVGLDPADSMLPALGESLERYCTCIYTEDQFITATAEDLHEDALDLSRIPVCSSAELSHLRCPLSAPDKKKPIRWVRGISLLDGRRVYLPVVMVYLHAGCASAAERFWFQITTGCAAHVSYERALLSAILEVIERDAVSILWLQKLPVPRIQVNQIPSSLAPYWDRYRRSSRELEYFFFDATTDLGLPTVYGLQVARVKSRLTTIVACSTALHPAEAIVKVMRELASCRIFLRAPRTIPEAWDDFTEIFHGSSYMARAEQAPVFDFLLQSGRKRPLNEISPFACTGDRESLQAVLELLRQKQLDAYAVDLSTDEALRSGVRVVRVLIPGLQPLGLQYRARYLGHPRLYDAPRQMGYPVRQEADLNHWPQPFC